VASLLAFDDVTFHDVYKNNRLYTEVNASGYQIKAFALFSTNVRHAMVLDADVIPMTNLDVIFDDAAYVETGALFNPDFFMWEFMLWKGPFARTMFGMSPLKNTLLTMDSSLFVFDRERHWRGLHVAHALNLRHDITYRYVLGDKDTYWIALDMCGERWSLTDDISPGSLSVTNCEYGGGWRGHIQFCRGVLTHINEVDFMCVALRYLRDKELDESTLFTHTIKGYLRHAEKQGSKNLQVCDVNCETRPKHGESIIPFSDEQKKVMRIHLSHLINLENADKMTRTYDG